MIIVRYNSNSTSFEEINESFLCLKKEFPDEKILALPQDWDILFNCSTSDLYYYKKMIEDIIHDKDLCEEGVK